jgi:hypothetical protein
MKAGFHLLLQTWSSSLLCFHAIRIATRSYNRNWTHLENYFQDTESENTQQNLSPFRLLLPTAKGSNVSVIASAETLCLHAYDGLPSIPRDGSSFAPNDVLSLDPDKFCPVTVVLPYCALSPHSFGNSCELHFVTA